MVSCKIPGSFFVFKNIKAGRKVFVHDISKEFKKSDDTFDVLDLFHHPEYAETVDIEIDGRSYTFFKIEAATVRDGMMVD